MCARSRAGALLTAHSTADTEGDFRTDLLIRLDSSAGVAVPTTAQETISSRSATAAWCRCCTLTPVTTMSGSPPIGRRVPVS
jgi:hypothetical protein